MRGQLRLRCHYRPEILASSLPISVIADIVGVPRSDWPPLQAAITSLLQVVELTAGPVELAAADGAATALREYFTALAAERRARRGHHDQLAGQRHHGDPGPPTSWWSW